MKTEYQVASDNKESMFIEFDMDEIRDLKYCYKQTMSLLIDELPDVNWNSLVETKQYFLNEHNLCLISTKIESLKETVDNIEEEEYLEHVDECVETLLGLIEYYKLRYTIRNYLDNIIRHEKDGKYPLRKFNNEWVMQNRQSLPYHPEIKAAMRTKGE